MSRDHVQQDQLASLFSLNYIGTEEDIKQISKYFDPFKVKPVPPLVVVGKPGSGKSTYLARWLKSPGVPQGAVIFYHAAFNAASSDPIRPLRRLITALQQELGWGQLDLPNTMKGITELLPQLILNVSAVKPVVIVLDGFDTLMIGNSSGVKAWFPSKFPTNTIVILSSSPFDPLLNLVQKNEWTKIEIEPVSLKDKGKVISKILLQKGKTLTKEQLRLVLTSESTNDHLFLSTLLDDLCSLPPDKIDTCLVEYLGCPDSASLFFKIIKRLETTHTPQTIEGILKRLCLARYGFSQKELLAMMQLEKICSAADFEKAWNDLKHLFLSIDGYFLFANERYQNIVEKVFLSDPKAVEACARKIANFFEKLLEIQKKKGQVDDRVVDEMPYAVYKTGDTIWLKEVLLEPLVFLKLSTRERMYELQDLWKKIETFIEMAEDYSEMLLGLGSEEEKPSNEILFSLFNRIADLCIDVQAYQYALFIAEKAVDLKLKILVPVHAEIAMSYYQQGVVYQMTKRYELALESFQRALSIYEEVPSPGMKQMIDLLTHMATCHEALNQFEKTIPLYARCSAVQKKAHGPHHPSVAKSLEHLANAHILLGQYEKADQLYQHTLNIQEHTFGLNHPEVALLLNNMANLYQKMAQYDRALPLFERALKILETTLGPSHPEVAATLNNQAKLFESMGLYEKAIPIFERSLKIREKHFGPENPEVATTLNNLGVLYYSMNQHEKAEDLYEKALAIREKTLGMDHPAVANTLNNIGVLYEKLNENAKAMELHKHALSIQQIAFGSNHLDVAVTLNNMAVLKEKAQAYEEAKQLYEQVLGIRKSCLGDEHPDVAVTLNNQATLLKKMGDTENALDRYIQADAIAQKVLGPGHPLSITIRKNKAELVNQNPTLPDQPREGVEAASNARVFLSGELFKKSGGFQKNWKKRLFFLNKTRLEWYEDKDPTPKNYILFANISSVSVVDEAKHKRKFVFEIVTPDQVYCLQAESEQNMNEWVDNLKKVISGK